MYAWIEDTQRAFAVFHPGVRLRLQLFSDSQIVPQLQRRHASGLGPDLVFVGEKTAFELESRGLSRPLRLPARVLAELDSASLQRLRRADGSLSALPLLMQPELACFDRRRVPDPPASLEALLAASADGVREAFLALRPGGSPNVAQRQRIRSWLAWMKAADLQHRLHFLADRQALEEQLLSGRMDWISCRGSQLSRLRRVLGSRLGVSVLPAGPGGPPTPVSSLRLLALGRDSSPVQQRLAERLALFTVSPQVQSSFTISSLSLLPVNRAVPVPVASSVVLASLLQAHQQASRGAALGRLLQPGSVSARAIRQELIAFLYGDTNLEPASTRLIAQLTGAGRRFSAGPASPSPRP